MINFTEPEQAKEPTIPFTNEQLEPINNSADRAILVDSTAGSGKTAMLQKVAFNAPESKILYLAYNKNIVEDIKTKLPGDCDVSTFHAFGLKIIRENLSNLKVDFNKYRNIEPIFGISALISKHMSLGGAHSRMKWEETCDRYHLDKSAIPAAMKAYETGIKKKAIVSGEDMIAQPVRENYDFPEYDTVLVDEYQDIGIDKLNLLSRIPTKRIIFVGDVQQKINSFMGSDPFVEENINRAFNTKNYSINQTFRCPEKVVLEARKFFSGIHTKKEGGCTSRVSLGGISAAEFPGDSLILCRANAPLLELAKKFIRAKMAFKVNPATIKKFSSVIKRLSRNTSNIHLVRENCEREMAIEINRYEKNGWNHEIVKLKYEAIQEILSIGSSLREAEAFVKTLINTDKNKCRRTLSTIHSAKGLESENVFYLNQNLGFRIARKTKIEWQRVEEHNLHFVAITRSLKNLTFID